MAAMEIKDWASIIVAFITLAGTIITSFRVKPAENIEKIIGSVEKLKGIDFSASAQNNKRKNDAIDNLLERRT